MGIRKNLAGAGAGFLGFGATFMAIALGTGQTALTGVAAAFSAPGVVCAGRSRPEG